MHDRRVRMIRGLGILVMLALLAGASGVAGPPIYRHWWRPRSPSEGLARATVRRADLRVSLRAGGWVESARKTMIVCELERLAMSVRGNAMAVGGSTVILDLLPEGTEVHRDDV